MNHWAERTDWHLVSSPLAPGEEDIENFLKFPNTHINEPLFTLVLGATEKLITAPWKNCKYMEVVDLVPERFPETKNIHAENWNFSDYDWLRMNLFDSFNLVVGDASIHCVDFKDYGLFCQNISNHMDSSSYLILRLFLPQNRNTLEILEDFKNCLIPNFHDFKRQLMCSLVDSEYKVILNDVWKAFHILSDHVIENTFLVNDWDKNLLSTIESFKDNYNFYTFPPLVTLIDKFKPYFHPIATYTSFYKNGDYYPVVVFRKV